MICVYMTEVGITEVPFADSEPPPTKGSVRVTVPCYLIGVEADDEDEEEARH